jgi:N utilization substance protein B
MANRHLARSIVLQTLFEWDSAEAGKIDVADALTRNIEEFAPDSKDHAFMEGLLDGVLAKQKDIDLIIEKAAPDWPLEKISTVDRNILRIGLFELLFADREQVPAKVAINEAIELAKTFGGESSGRFVNGVLGAVYKEIGEPGKNDTGKKNKKDIPVEKYGGAVVYAIDDGQTYLALVHDIFGHWTLSKGHIEEDPSVEAGIVRVIKEELDLDVQVEDKVGENEYVASYHLARADFAPLTLKKSGGLDDAKWFKLQDILELNFYRDMLPVVTEAVQTLAAKKDS